MMQKYLCWDTGVHVLVNPLSIHLTRQFVTVEKEVRKLFEKIYCVCVRFALSHSCQFGINFVFVLTSTSAVKYSRQSKHIYYLL